MNPTDWTIFAIAVCVMLAGVLGTVVPFLPGLPLIWGTMLVYGIIEEFSNVNAVFLVVTFAVVLVTEAADYFARAWGARRFGASKSGAVGAVIGSVIGLFFLPLGLILGPFLGVVIAELMAGRSTSESVRAGWGGLIGTLGSIVVKFVVAVAMTIVFVVRVL